MPEEEKANSGSQKNTRRNVLKTAGGVGVAALSVPGLASASTTDGFLCSVDIPAFFEKDESPLNPNQVGTVRGGWPADGIFIPDDMWLPGCSFDCSTYAVNLPFTVTWKTDASSSDIGNVAVNLELETPGSPDSNSNGWSWLLDNQEMTLDSQNVTGSLTGKYANVNVSASNLFRPTYLTMTLDFTDSAIYNEGDEKLSKRYEWATPNKSLLQETKNLVDYSADVWDAGVDLSDKLVSIDVSTMQKATRLWAYSSTASADMIDPDGLPENAVFKGISAFSDPIEDRQEKTVEGWDEPAVETTAGPTIGYKDT